jgi:DNA-binding IclR family transcriptional regulator
MILVLGKALNILELLAKSPNKEMSLGEIAEKLNMDKGTCVNIIKSLASRGYVQQIGPRQGYKFGYMIYNLTGSAVINDELTEIARKDIEDLGTSINESTILSVIRNDKRIILFQTIPDREIFVKANIDKSVYSANSARVIIANYSPTRLEKFINRVGLPTRDQWPEVYHSANVKGELMNELCIIKNKGYEISSDSNDVVGFAAPIFSHGHISGSVGIYLPSYRLGNKDLILKKVLSCAESISNKIAEPFPSAPDSVV